MRFGIRAKLLGAFAVVILLAATVGAVGIFSLSKVDQIAEVSYNSPFAFVSKAAEARARLGFMDSRIEQRLLDPTATGQSKFEAGLQEDVAAVDKLISEGHAADLAEVASQETSAFSSDWRQYQDLADSVANELAANDAAGATRLYLEQGVPLYSKVDADLAQLIQTHEVEARNLNDEITAVYTGSMNLMLGLLVVALLLGGGISFVLSRNVSNAVKQVALAASGLSRGELNQQIDVRSKDELGDMADSLRQMIAYQNEMAGVAEAISRGELADSVHPKSPDDVLGNALQRMIAYQNEMARVADLIAAGDLTPAVQPQSPRDVFGNAFQRMLSNLRKMLSDLVEAASVLSASASEIMATTTQMAAGAAETATAVTETTATVEQVKQTAQLSSEKARSVSESALRSAQVSQVGTKAVDEAIGGMDRIRHQMESIADSIMRLSEQRQAIGEIISTVSDLAEQSNLLAVNAAIEAAKAGEQGRGFAVVAQEVKRLAEQSKQATLQVRGILSDIEKATTAAVMATEQGSKAVDTGARQSTGAGESIRALAESISDATQAATQITASSQQQLIGMDQIVLAMQNIKQASVQNVASTRQAEQSAQSLHELGQKLKLVVAQYRV
jgi:methyl-accepting chemotaxis protein